MKITKIAIFCGASTGINPIFAEKAYTLGQFLAERSIGIVFGGGKIGLMGKVADGALQCNGLVTGVIPSFLKKKEVAHEGLTEMITVETMHERKTKMHELSHGVIALPGGFGTMEELFEMITWGQLGLHQKPIGLLNILDFYNPLIEFLDMMKSNGFIDESLRNMIQVSEEIEDLVYKLETYQSPFRESWIDQGRT